jgi:glycosyltransferase involved in cell wall biosynthesis
MKIALYQPWIYLHGGLERSILELVKRSRHHWTIFTGLYDRAGTFPEFASLDVRELNKTSVNRKFSGVLRSSVQVLREKLPLDPDTDAITVWCDGIGDLITFRNHSRPVMNICSTPLRPAFDPVYETLALRYAGPFQKLLFAVFKHGFRVIDRLAWRHYSGVIATSQEVKSRILAGRLYRDDGRMTMAYPGIDWNPVLGPVRYEPYILVPGRIMWTKNIQQGIRAFLRANLPQPWKLVVAGFVDAKSRSYLESLRNDAEHSPRVEFIVSPSDEQLDALYRGAAFCLFTALNEDWGIVPLEAMARGKAVIANDRGGPRESIAHGQTGYLLEPDETQWANAIASLASDPELMRRLGGQAHAQVERFTWTRFAERVDAALDAMVAGTLPAAPAGVLAPGGHPAGQAAPSKRKAIAE